MQLLRAEWKKHRTFREVWVGYLLGAAFLALGLYMQWKNNFPIAQNTWQYWFLLHQNIYSYGAVLTAFLVVIGLSRLICYETNCKTDAILRTTKNGVSDTFRAKAILTFQYCAIIIAVIGVLNIVVNGAWFRYEGAFSRITESLYFKEVPLSNLLYAIVQYLFLFLGALYFAGFILIIAAIVKRSALVILVSGSCFIVSLVYYYAGYLWVQGTWLGKPCDFIFHYGFGGFLLQESFSKLSAARGAPTGDWAYVWRPVIFVIIMIMAEFVIAWFLWRRRER